MTSPGRLRAMTALLLLAPGTPMLFHGQEFASSSPFYYFADHEPDLANQTPGGVDGAVLAEECLLLRFSAMRMTTVCCW